jgi:cytochrome c
MKYILILTFIISNQLFAAQSGEELVKKNGCLACHSIKVKVLGPAYLDVSKKYKEDQEVFKKLSLKIRNGGSGNWGNIPMPANQNLTDTEIKAIISWILSLH